MATFNTAMIGTSSTHSYLSNPTRIFLERIPSFPLHSYDIIFLQEIGRILSPQNLLSPFLKLSNFSIDDQNPHASIGTFYNDSRFTLLDSQEILRGRCISDVLEDKISGTKIAYVNIYGFPNSSNTGFINLFRSINCHFTLLQKKFGSSLEIVIGGDFNIQLTNSSPNSMLLREFCNDLKLFEATKDVEVTWRGSGSRSGSYSKIDHIFASYCFWQSIDVVPTPTSDHYLIVSTKKETISKDPDPPPFIFKNTHLLKDRIKRKLIASNTAEDIFLNTILPNPDIPTLRKADLSDHKNADFSRKIDEVLVAYSPKNPMEHFNRLMNSISDQVDQQIQKAQAEYRRARNRLNRVENKFLKTNKNTQDRNEARQEFLHEIRKIGKEKELKQQIRKLMTPNQSLQGFYARARRKTTSSIRVIKHPDTGEMIYDEHKIMEIFANHHRAKCSDSSTWEQTAVTNTHDNPDIVKIAEKYGFDLELHFPPQKDLPKDHLIKPKQVRRMMKRMKKFSAPGRSGMDRIVILFLLDFFPVSIMNALHFLSVSNQWENSNETKYLKMRRIIFIPKRSLDMTLVNNYRPISLIEIIFKILSKHYSDLVLPGVTAVVSQDQFGFIPGRVMSNASLTLIGIIEKLKNKFPRSVIWFADIKAAFDRAKAKPIAHLFKLLFPNSDIPDILTDFNKGAIAIININNSASQPIPLTCGTGQGDPSSSTRFSLLHAYWQLMLHHILSSKLLDLALPIELIAHPNHQPTQKIIPSVAFADDTSLPLQIPSDTESINRLHLALQDLEGVTGLEINYDKSEVLPMNHPILTTNDKNLLKKLGRIVDIVSHLGIKLAADYEKARTATYSDATEAMEKAAKRIIPLLSSTDMLTKRMAINTTISSILNHRLRVYPPPKHTIDKSWKIVRQALWTHKYHDVSSTRHKISSENVSRSVLKGGLKLISPKQSAISSFISSILSIFDFTNFQTQSIMNTIEDTYSTKQHMFFLLNATNFEKIIGLLPNIFPKPDKWMMTQVEETLLQLELDPQLLWQAPTYCHHLIPLRKIVPSPIGKEKYRLINQAFPTIASLCERQRNGLLLLHENSSQLQELESTDPEQFNKLTTLRRKIASQVPKIASTPTRVKNPRDTWTSRAVNTSLKFIKTALQRVFQKVQYKEGEEYVPPSYASRIRDNIDVPKNPKNFIEAYRLLQIPKVPSRIRSFHLEMLNRTTVSSVKLNKWTPNPDGSAIIPSEYCQHCKCPANSTHIIHRCVLPFMCRAFVKQIIQQEKLPEIMREETYLDFGWPVTMSKEIHPSTYPVLATFITALRYRCHKVFTENPRFEMFTEFKFAAQAIISVRNAISIAGSIENMWDESAPILEKIRQLHTEWDALQWIHLYHEALHTVHLRDEYFAQP